jgi:hypothetical protein
MVSTNKIVQLLDFENQNQLINNHASNILKNIKLSYDHLVSLPTKIDINKVLQNINSVSKSLSMLPTQVNQSLEKIVLSLFTEIQNINTVIGKIEAKSENTSILEILK